MFHYPASVVQDEERLGQLAMTFRGTRDTTQREEIAAEYSRTVNKLIASGQWQTMPGPEDQLSDDSMPPAFFEYWSRST
ncbi:MAG: hypothetical protein K8T91_07240 [Planctomycetes bacterium]|nr:hypothetical protein [Planctomycetota bacterium]